MHRMTSRGLILMAVLAVIPLGASGATPEPTSGPGSFLAQAAGGQQSEMDLGQLAIQKAADEQVKQLGARMVEDHQKAREEIRQLASKEGIQVPAQPSEQQKQVKAQLSKLSGKEFDRLYITTMLGEHAKSVKDFEQQSLMGQNKEVRQWAAGAVPVLKEHLQKVQTIASSLRFDAAPAR